MISSVKSKNRQQKHSDNIIWLDLLNRLKARLDLAWSSFHKQLFQKGMFNDFFFFELNFPPYVVPSLYDFFILWNTLTFIIRRKTSFQISKYILFVLEIFPILQNQQVPAQILSLCYFFTTADVE